MPKIIHPYATGRSAVSNAIDKLGATMFGDTLTPALKREKWRGLSVQNKGIADMIALTGKNILATDPRMRSAAIGANRSKNLPGMHNFGVANDPNSTENAITRSMLGMGKAMSLTPDGFNATLEESKREAKAKIADDILKRNNELTTIYKDGKYLLVPRSQAEGMTPPVAMEKVRGGLLSDNFDKLGALDPSQKKVVGGHISPTSGPQYKTFTGKDGQTYRSPDGLNDSYGKRLPQGALPAKSSKTAQDIDPRPLLAEPVRGKMQGARRESVKLLGMITHVLPLTAHSENFGVEARTESMLRQGQAMLSGIMRKFGWSDPTSALHRTAATLADKMESLNMDPATLGVLPADLTAVQSFQIALLYRYASAMLGQKGRSFALSEVTTVAKKIISDPLGWGMSSSKFKNQLNNMRSQVMSDIRGDDIFQEGFKNPANPPWKGAAPAAPQPAPPAEAPLKPIPFPSMEDDDEVGVPDDIDPEDWKHMPQRAKELWR